MNVHRMRRFFTFLPLLLISTPLPVLSLDDKDHLILNVNGMHCQSCVSMVRKTVKKISGVESVAVDLGKGVVEVTGDSLLVRREMVAEAIERMGYDVEETDSVNAVKADSIMTPGR